jgi:hypothetical protein
VVCIGWPSGGKAIEHKANPEPSGKDRRRLLKQGVPRIAVVRRLAGARGWCSNVLTRLAHEAFDRDDPFGRDALLVGRARPQRRRTASGYDRLAGDDNAPPASAMPGQVASDGQTQSACLRDRGRFGGPFGQQQYASSGHLVGAP